MDWLAPTLGLAGVLAAAVIAFFATRRTAGDTRRGQFQERRANALEDLIRRLDDLELHVRRGGRSSVGFIRSQIGPLNIFLKNHRDLLRDDEAQAARQKLRGLIHLAERYTQATPKQRRSIQQTDPNPIVDEPLAEAFRTFERVDKLLARRLREARGGPRRL